MLMYIYNIISIKFVDSKKFLSSQIQFNTSVSGLN